MDVSHLLDALNDAQRQAVAAPLAPTLVLAGAGSGKTRVLTHRVAWLVQVENVSPHGILAVTFTNKAAGEMRGRIETQLGLPSAPLWVGTFHGIAHRLLRMHWREAGLPQSFQILDSEDQQRLVRKVVRSFELDEARWISEGNRLVHQRTEGRGSATEASQGRGRPDPPADDPAVRCVRGDLPAQRRSGFRRAAAAQFRALAGGAGSRRALPQPFRTHPGRRVPGHERDPVLLGQGARRIGQHPLRRRRRRPIHLSLAWGEGREPAAVPPGFPGRAALPSRAELPLDRQHPGGRQRDHLQQRRAHRQEALDQRRARRADPPLPRLQRARRSRVRRRPCPRLDRTRREARGHRDPVPLECAVARVRGVPARRPHPLSRLRGLEVLRARRDQGRAGLPAPDQQSRRRRIVRARGEPAHARDRHTDTRGSARICARQRDVAVAGERRLPGGARNARHRVPADLPCAHRAARRRDARVAAA